MAEMVEAFDIADVKASPARFDQAKADAINAEHLRRLEPADFAARLLAYLEDHDVVSRPATDEQRSAVEAAAPLVQTRMQVLGEAVGMLGFLFVEDGALVLEDDGRAQLRKDVAGSAAVLDASSTALGELPAWTTADIESALRAALLDGLGLKPRVAFTPLRVAVTGRRVSPPLFESMEILGRSACLARVNALRAELQGDVGR
jgi:glutamyl-tRNA synthetase